MTINYLFYRFHDTTDDGSDKFAVKTWFLNPYTDRKVHFVICPSHQVIIFTHRMKFFMFIPLL